MPTANVIASNCRMLRTARGLSQAEVAEKAGLSRPGYIKVESGGATPRADTLQQLAAALGVQVAALLRPVDRLEHVRFRSKKRINSREELLGEVKRRLDAYDELARAVGGENQQVQVTTSKDAREAADKVRRMLLKKHPDEPVRDICGLVESAGYRLLLVTLTSAFEEDAEGEDRAAGFFGLSVLNDGRPPAIVVNNFERISVERRIFTVAHELGHIHLHRDAYHSDQTDELETEEREADLFASHFLMPESLFKKEWEEAYGLPFVERVLKVKRIFRVSYKTVLRRLEEEGEKKVYPKFFGIFKKRFGRSLRQREEPAPLDEADFKQDVLPSLVRRGVEKEVLSQSKAAELLGLDLGEFREWAAAWDEKG